VNDRRRSKWRSGSGLSRRQSTHSAGAASVKKSFGSACRSGRPGWPTRARSTSHCAAASEVVVMFESGTERTRILHCFADHGTEAEVLSAYGDVIRVGHGARDTNQSHPIKADARQLPFGDNVRFDFGLFHPPCTPWSDMPDANKAGDAPNLIPLAREIAEKHCDYWVIENKPRAPLDDPVLLNGDHFGLPIEYERAFETNFPVEEPPRQAALVELSFSTRVRRTFTAKKAVRGGPLSRASTRSDIRSTRSVRTACQHPTSGIWSGCGWTHRAAPRDQATTRTTTSGRPPNGTER